MKNVIIVITTYKRSALLLKLLKNIKKEEKGFNLFLRIYEDFSDEDYTSVMSYLYKNFRDNHTYIKSPFHFGKSDYWKLRDFIYDDLKSINFDYVIQLDDDLTLCDNFFEKAINEYNIINDDNKICLNLLNDYLREGKSIWTSIKSKLLKFNNSEIYQTGWVDMIFIAERKFFEALDYKILPVSQSHTNNTELSSGIGMQVSQKLYRKFNFYQVKNSFVIHGTHDSVMHPEHRKKNKLLSNNKNNEYMMLHNYSITVGIASMPSRIESLRDTIKSLFNQVDMIFIYLNDYKEVPTFLYNDKIKIFRSQDEIGDIGDVGKFYNCENVRGYFFTADDDIIYPSDYIENSKKEIDKYNRGIVITYHGRIFDKLPAISYYKSSTKNFDCLQTILEDKFIHVGGTGVIGYHSNHIILKLSDFKTSNMADIWFSKICQEQNIPILCLKHKKGWIKLSEKYNKNESIKLSFIDNDEYQTEVLNSIDLKINTCNQNLTIVEAENKEKIINEPLKCIIVRDREYNSPFLPVKKMILSKYSKLSEYNNAIVLLGYNTGCDITKYRTLYPGKKLIIYQLEQLYNNKSSWYNIKSNNSTIVNRTLLIQKLLKECDEIWDYDYDNTMFLLSEGFKNIKHVPLFYSNDLIKKNDIKKPEYDILFFGSINDRRAKFLSLLTNYNICIIAPKQDCIKYKNYNFGKFLVDAIFTDDLFDYIFNSKIIINIHYYESILQEQVRIFELLINNKLVLSENSKRNYFGDLIEEFFTEKEMIEKIDYILLSESWKNINVSKRFCYKNYKRYRIGAAYNTFYGLDLIEKSIKSIKDVVDYIVIVHQKVGMIGQKEPAINKKILKKLKDKNLVDDIIYYVCDDNNAQSNIIAKRNLGLDYCRKNDCDFIIPLDADERYNATEISEEISEMYECNIDTLYSPIYSYYYDEKHYFLDSYYVPSVFRINDRNFQKINSSVLADPVRKMIDRNYKISKIHMHHYTYLKKSFVNKIGNSMSSFLNQDIKNKMIKIRDYLSGWKEEKDALVFVNDVGKGGVVLKLIKLLKK